MMAPLDCATLAEPLPVPPRAEGPHAPVHRGMDAAVPYATVASARGIGVTPALTSFAALADEMRRHGETLDGKDGPAVVMSAFREGQGTTPTTRGRVGRWRQLACIAETWFLGLDFDSRPDAPARVVAPLAAAGLAHIAYSTHSHGRLDYLRAKARGELAPHYDEGALAEAVERYARAPRYRVLVRLARSVSPEEYRALWAWLDDHLGGGSDRACSDPTRLYYTPRRAADDAQAPPWVTYVPGEALDPDALPDGTDVATLLAQMAEAGRGAPRAPLAPAEAERRRTEALALPQEARTRAARRAYAILAATVDRLATTSEGGRRKAIYRAGCRLGEWEHVLTPSDAAAWRAAILDAAAHHPDPEDHARQLDNGRDRGRSAPKDVRAEDRASGPSPLESGPAPLPLAEAREQLVQLVRRATTTPGTTCIAADPGCGKTTAVVAEVPRLVAEGRRVRIASPTNRLAGETLAAVRRAIDDAGDIVATCGLAPKRTRHNCQNLLAVEAGRRAAGPGGAAAVCRECDLHPRHSGPGACAFFGEVIAAQGYDVTVTTHALEVSRARDAAARVPEGDDDEGEAPPDLLVVDEAPTAADARTTATWRDLCALRGAGDVIAPDDAWERLRELVATATHPDAERRRHVGASDLAEALPQGSVTARRGEDGRVVPSLGWGLVIEHGATAATGELPKALAEAPDAAVLEALETACQRGWSGCYISRTGELEITTPLAPAGEAVTTIYLDGTATEASARALFGPECRYERLRVSLHPDTTVQCVSWSAAKRTLPPRPPDDDDETTPRVRERRERARAARRESLTYLAAVVRRYESESTAWVLHKAWREDPDVVALLSEAVASGRVTHYRGAEATGSNVFEGCERIVLADWFVPRAAISAHAQTLAWRAREHAGVDVDWHAEARCQLEESTRVQAAYRVRPGAAAREIVWLAGHREMPHGPDWPTPVDVDADELVLDELGILPPGRRGAALLLRRAVAEAPAGVVAPARDETWRRAADAWSHDGRSVAWADEAGVVLAYARASDGSAPVLYHAKGVDPTPEAVAEAVLAARGEGAPPLAWVEWAGVRVTTGPCPEDEGRRLLAMLREMTMADERPTWDALAAAAGVSPSTVRRRLRPLGVVSLDDLARASQIPEGLDEPLPLPEGLDEPVPLPEPLELPLPEALGEPLPLPEGEAGASARVRHAQWVRMTRAPHPRWPRPGQRPRRPRAWRPMPPMEVACV